MTNKLRQDPISAVIGQNIQRLRREHGLNSKDFLLRLSTDYGLEMTESQLSKLENGHLVCIDREHIVAFCSIFHLTSADELIFTSSERDALVKNAWTKNRDGILIP